MPAATRTRPVLLPDRHPYVFEALCIRAEGIRINFVPNVFGDPMYSMSLLHHRRLFEVGLRIIGVTQELHVLVFVYVATCDSALTDLYSAEPSAAKQKWILFDRGELRHLFYFI